MFLSSKQVLQNVLRNKTIVLMVSVYPEWRHNCRTQIMWATQKLYKHLFEILVHVFCFVLRDTCEFKNNSINKKARLKASCYKTERG